MSLGFWGIDLWVLGLIVLLFHFLILFSLFLLLFIDRLINYFLPNANLYAYLAFTHNLWLFFPFSLLSWLFIVHLQAFLFIFYPEILIYLVMQLLDQADMKIDVLYLCHICFIIFSLFLFVLLLVRLASYDPEFFPDLLLNRSLPNFNRPSHQPTINANPPSFIPADTRARFLPIRPYARNPLILRTIEIGDGARNFLIAQLYCLSSARELGSLLPRGRMVEASGLAETEEAVLAA